MFFLVSPILLQLVIRGQESREVGKRSCRVALIRYQRLPRFTSLGTKEETHPLTVTKENQPRALAFPEEICAPL
jgi:hypothetical protein